MATKALLGATQDWINVTPETEVSLAQISASSLDERAWQRDISKFKSKATRTQLKHILRETVVIRIPYDAQDGYFRLVLTASVDSKRNVLCPSPVFRVASTSMSASCLKGASLTTLPLELGVKAAQTAAGVFVAKATATATLAATPLKIKAVERVASAPVVKKYGGYAETAWEASGMSGHIRTANETFDSRRKDQRPMLDRTVSAPSKLRGNVIGDDETGPTSPFPIQVWGVVRDVADGNGGSTHANFDHHIENNGPFTSQTYPTGTLTDLPSHLLSSIAVGIYCGWALIVPKKNKNKDVSNSNTQGKAREHLNLYNEWHPAIITVSFGALVSPSPSDHPPPPTTSPMPGLKIAQRKQITAKLLYTGPTTRSDFPSSPYPSPTPYCLRNTTINIHIMGYLRPLLPPIPTLPTNASTRTNTNTNTNTYSNEDQEILAMLETINDIQITQASLSRPKWACPSPSASASTSASTSIPSPLHKRYHNGDRDIPSSSSHLYQSHSKAAHLTDPTQNIALSSSLEEASIVEKLVSARIAAQTQIDRIPVHRLGIRNDAMGVHDAGVFGRGGFWIRRD